jgi:hypothetical protein
MLQESIYITDCYCYDVIFCCQPFDDCVFICVDVFPRATLPPREKLNKKVLKKQMVLWRTFFVMRTTIDIL